MTDTLIVMSRAGVPVASDPVGAVCPGDPFAAGRTIAFRGTDGHVAGVARASGAVAIAALPHAECVVPVQGQLMVDDRIFGPGTAFVLPRGFSGTLTASNDACWLFTAEGGQASPASETALIVLDPALPRNPSPGPAAEVLIGPAPQCHSLNLFTDTPVAPPPMRAGVWDVSTPCERSFVPHKVHELMAFLEGSVTLTHRSGSVETFHAGDAVFIPRGAPYAWKSDVKVVKFYTVI